ncbi:hypothetical protein AAC387_Pa02g3245 [Persea americana]
MDEIMNWMRLDDEIIGRLQANEAQFHSPSSCYGNPFRDDLFTPNMIRCDPKMKKTMKLLAFSPCCLFARVSKDGEGKAPAMAEACTSWEMAVVTGKRH